jgi:hypothetical protein
MKSEAEKFLTSFFKIKDRDDGLLEFKPLRSWLNKVKKSMVKCEYETPESFDSSIVCTFSDGSSVVISNPLQECFPCFASLGK